MEQHSRALLLQVKAAAEQQQPDGKGMNPYGMQWQRLRNYGNCCAVAVVGGMRGQWPLCVREQMRGFPRV